MRVNRIVINSILGIDHLEIEPGAITQIYGENGAGKTSVLESIRAALSGGTDATILKSGAESGEVVLILDDGTTINRKVTSDSSTISVTHPEFGRISKPAQYLKKLSDALSLNPIDFLMAPGKSRAEQSKYRVETLLQAIPMKVTTAQLMFVPQVALQGVSLDDHALEVIGKIQKAVYDLRTGVNRSITDKRASIRQMTETLPADAPEGDWKQSLQVANDEYLKLQKSVAASVKEIDAEASESKKVAEKFCDAHIDGIKEELRAAIDKLKDEAQMKIDAAGKTAEGRCTELEAVRLQKRAELESECLPKAADLKERIGQAKAMIEQHAASETTRQHIAQWTREADALDSEANKLTDAHKRLETLKASLLEKLPIEGLEVKDGDIFVGGVAFDRVNESKRIRLAIEIAKLRSGSLGLVAVDGLERMDAKTFAAFKKEAEKSKLQFVISRVSEGPLTVETEGAA